MLHKAMNPPQAPDSLPKYIAEGIPKQDDSTIEDLREYSEAILEHRQQARAEAEVTAEDIPSNAERLGTDEAGTFVAETVTCGDQSCGCMNGGKKHGPYVYRYVYNDGTLTSEYLGKQSELKGDIDV